MDDAEENIIEELNARFQELRSLLITIGSVLAMLIAGLNEIGFIDFAVDSLVDIVKDDPELNPYLNDCQEDWTVIEDSYLVENAVTLNVRFADASLCSYQHNGTYAVSATDGRIRWIENTSIRNSGVFSNTFSNLSDGDYWFLYEYTSPYMSVAGSVWYSVESDGFDEDVKVYGCTDTNSTNYDTNATDNDGSCEYEEEVYDDCYATIYDAYSYWADNNSSIYSDFDVDWSCDTMANVTVTVEIWNEMNTTLYLSGSVAYETNYYDVDYQFADFTNVTDEGIIPTANWRSRIQVTHADVVHDEWWVLVE